MKGYSAREKHNMTCFLKINLIVILRAGMEGASPVGKLLCQNRGEMMLACSRKVSVKGAYTGNGKNGYVWGILWEYSQQEYFH